MQTSTSMFAGLSRLIEDNTEPLLAVSMFGFVFLSVLAIIHAAQSRATIRKRTIAYNPAYFKAPQSVHPLDSDGRGPQNVEDVSELLFAVERGLGASSERRISKIRGELIRAGYFRKDAVPCFYIARVTLGLPVRLLLASACKHFDAIILLRNRAQRIRAGGRLGRHGDPGTSLASQA